MVIDKIGRSNKVRKANNNTKIYYRAFRAGQNLTFQG
jgi:hypothetical protein